MNVSSLGISTARLPVLAGRSLAVSDEAPPARKTREEAVPPAERVYVGEYVAAGTGSTFFFRDDTYSARQYGGSKAGNRHAMVQAYQQNSSASPAGGRASGRIDYFA